MVAWLYERYREAVIAQAVTGDGALLEVFATEDSSAYSITVTSPEGMSCLKGWGMDWEVAPWRTPEIGPSASSFQPIADQEDLAPRVGDRHRIGIYCPTLEAHLEHWRLGAAGDIGAATIKLQELLERGRCLYGGGVLVVELAERMGEDIPHAMGHFEPWKVWLLSEGGFVYVVLAIKASRHHG